MKLSKMISLCKKEKHVFLYKDDKDRDLKYLSDGHILFRLKDYSSVCLDNIFEFMDVPDDRKEKYHADVRPIMFETYVDESTNCEKLTRFPKSINIPDPVVAFSSDKGMLLVQDKFLDVFRPMPGYIEYYMSVEKFPMLLLVCGKEVIGGIWPLKYDFEKLHDELSAMTYEAHEAYLNHFNSTSHQVDMEEVLRTDTVE